MLPVSVLLLDSLDSEHNSVWGDLLQELMVQFRKIQAQHPSLQKTNTQSQSADSRESNS